MTDLLKNLFSHFILPILVPIVLGLGSAVISAQVMLGKLEARVTAIETMSPRMEKIEDSLPQLELRIGRNERALEKDFNRHEQVVQNLGHKMDDLDKRTTKLEALSSQTREILTEVRSDVKLLLRGKHD